MTPTPEGRDRLQGLVAGATEAEVEPNRHHMEEAILATLATTFFDQDKVAHAAMTVAWSRADLKAIADALIKSVMEGKGPDLVVIQDKLRSTRIQNAVLTDIMAGKKAKSVSVVLDYIRIMHVQDKRRAALDAGREYLAKVETGDVDAAVGGLIKTVCDLVTSKGLVTAYPTVAENIPGFLTTLSTRRTDGRAWLGLDCGFRHLNEVLNGLTEGVFVLAGMPSCGKTTLATQIADHVAMTEKVPVLFYSYEQSAEELWIKSLSRLAAVNSRQIWKGRTNKDTWKKVEDAAEAYRRGAGPCLTIIEAERTDTIEAIRATALMAKHKAGTGKKVLLILDYLQIVPTPGEIRLNAIKDKVDWNLSELRRLSRDLESPILVVSTLNRAAYGEPSKPPTLVALKESGGIEYSADAVLCLWRDNEETSRMEIGRKVRCPDDPKTIRVEAHVLKNRNGELAKVKLDFTPAWASFGNEGRAEDLP